MVYVTKFNHLSYLLNSILYLFLKVLNVTARLKVGLKKKRYLSEKWQKLSWISLQSLYFRILMPLIILYYRVYIILYYIIYTYYIYLKQKQPFLGYNGLFGSD